MFGIDRSLSFISWNARKGDEDLIEISLYTNMQKGSETQVDQDRGPGSERETDQEEGKKFVSAVKCRSSHQPSVYWVDCPRLPARVRSSRRCVFLYSNRNDSHRVGVVYIDRLEDEEDRVIFFHLVRQ